MEAAETTENTEAPAPAGNTGANAGTLNVLDTRWAMANDDQWNVSKATWQSLIASGVLPKHVRTPETAMALAEAGRVHGWSPLQSVRLLCLIEGQVAMTVNGLWMLVTTHVRSEPGARVRLVENSLERAAIEVVRPEVSGDEPFIYEFTRADAETAKLWGKQNRSGTDSPWILYPRDMLMARCKARVARNAFGDVVHGAYTDEELVSAGFRESADAIVEDILKRKAEPAVRPTTLDDVAAKAKGTSAA